MMSMVVLLMLDVKWLLDMVSGSSVSFKCPYCKCVFCTQHDLDLHLKRFGDCDHLDLWECVHILMNEDGHDAGVDEHGDWHWRYKGKGVSSSKIRKCRRIIAEHGFVL